MSLITFDDGSKTFYPLSSLVKRLPLDIARPSQSLPEGITNNVGRLTRLRQALKASKPDCIISFLYTTNIMVLLASRGLSYPVIVSERNDPRHRKENRSVWYALRRLTLPFLVVGSEAIMRAFSMQLLRLLGTGAIFCLMTMGCS